LGAETSLPEAFFSLWRKDKRPRSCNSQTAFRKNTPERERRIRLMNRPSTVVMEPAVKIQTIPATGTRQKTMEIKNVAARKRPPLVTLILDSSRTRLSLKPRAVCACAQFTGKNLLGGLYPVFPNPGPQRWLHCLKVISTVLLSLGASVTFTSCSPSFSCTKANV